MPQFVVTIYDFWAKPPDVSVPQAVEAPNALSAARLFTDEPLELTGHISNLAVEVKRFEGKDLVQRVMLYRKL